MLLVIKFCSITLDLLSPSHTHKAKTLFKSAWSRSDGFLMICEWWRDQKVWERVFLFADIFGGSRVVGFQCNRWMKTTAHTERLQCAKTLFYLVVGRDQQPCSQIINLPPLQHPIRLNMTDKEGVRETWVSYMGGGCATKMLSKKLSRQREASSFDFQIIQRPHTHWFLFPPLWNTPPIRLPKQV